MTDSHAYPDLERVPGKQNWVDKAGGLPSYIERIAKHLHYEQGMTISHAIATAVNTVKRWCKGGTVSKTGGPEGGQNVTAKTKAQACAALAEWDAKRGSASLSLGWDRDAMSDDDFAEMLENRVGLHWLLSQTQTPLDKEAYALALSQQRAEAGILDTSGQVEYTLNMAIFHWDPHEHPRDLLGKFSEKLDSMGDGGKVMLPDGITVTKKGGRFRIGIGDHTTPASFKKPESAAKKALDYSAANTHPDSLGGDVSYTDREAALPNQSLIGNAKAMLKADASEEEISSALDALKKPGDFFKIRDPDEYPDWSVRKREDGQFELDDHSGRPEVTDKHGAMSTLSPSYASRPPASNGLDESAVRDIVGDGITDVVTEPDHVEFTNQEDDDSFEFRKSGGTWTGKWLDSEGDVQGEMQGSDIKQLLQRASDGEWEGGADEEGMWEDMSTRDLLRTFEDPNAPQDHQNRAADRLIDGEYDGSLSPAGSKWDKMQMEQDGQYMADELGGHVSETSADGFEIKNEMGKWSFTRDLSKDQPVNKANWVAVDPNGNSGEGPTPLAAHDDIGFMVDRGRIGEKSEDGHSYYHGDETWGSHPPIVQDKTDLENLQDGRTVRLMAPGEKEDEPGWEVERSGKGYTVVPPSGRSYGVDSVDELLKDPQLFPDALPGEHEAPAEVRTAITTHFGNATDLTYHEKDKSFSWSDPDLNREYTIDFDNEERAWIVAAFEGDGPGARDMQAWGDTAEEALNAAAEEDWDSTGTALS